MQEKVSSYLSETRRSFLLKFLAAFLFGICFSILFSFNANAADYTVINVSEDDIEEDGADIAIQAALDEAAENATSSNPYKIVVPAGEYTVTYSLKISSNTYLYAQGCVFTHVSGRVDNMIRIGYSSDSTDGYAYANITIDGGTWDENGNSNTIIKLAHAKTVTVKNATFSNTYNAHIMEVAGVNGLTVSNCTFSDQELVGTDSATLQYEAIQLDILVKGHFSGYTYEDLATKNVTIENCTFDNVPRGIGSHTTVLNNPIDGLTITGNTFTNISSCPIHLINVKNCTISNNTLTSVPRGIYIYSYQLNGTYLSSILEDLGGIDSSTSNSYKTPTDANIVISGNTITISGEDSYKEYTQAGIFVSGLELTSASSTTARGTIPKGNYYITGVTISNNTIKTTGHGIRLLDTYDASVTGNTITYNGSSSGKFYGASLGEECSGCSIKSNTISGFYRGVYVGDGSSASEVSSNTIKKVSNNAIMVESATVSKIKSNVISSTDKIGIYVYNSAKVTYIKSNTISSPGSYGISVEKSSTASYIQKNTITSPGKHGIMVKSSSKVKEITSNTIKNGSKRGINIASLKCALKISSNTISKCGSDYLIYISPSTTSYTITIKSNKLTGTSKKQDGIKVNNGKISISSNTIKTCRYPVVINSAAKGSVYKNTITGNKYNKYKIGSTVTGNLKATSVSVSTKTKNSIKLKWDKVSGASGYVIYRSTSKSGTYSKVATVKSGSTKTYTNKSLKKSKKYYYKVRTYKTIGNIKLYSAYSTVVSGTTKSK